MKFFNLVRILFKNFHHRLNNHYVQVPESPSIISGVKYNEWQRNSGLRVLRKVLDRQKLLEATDGIGGKTQVGFLLKCICLMCFIGGGVDSSGPEIQKETSK